MRLLVWFLALFGIGAPSSNAQMLEGAGETSSISVALSLTPRSMAYGSFIEIFLLTSPHPSQMVRGQVDRARSGEGDAFARVAFMIWQGDSGFRMHKPGAVLGLLAAYQDGSGEGAFFMGETFLQLQARNDVERAESYRKALPWYGKADAMGVGVAYDRALDLMTFIEATMSVSREELLTEYTQGQKDVATKALKAKDR